jgi:hypothetical protein
MIEKPRIPSANSATWQVVRMPWCVGRGRVQAPDGAYQALADRCPHRGTNETVTGHVVNGRLNAPTIIGIVDAAAMSGYSRFTQFCATHQPARSARMPSAKHMVCLRVQLTPGNHRH